MGNNFTVTNLVENYTFVYTVYDTEKLTFCDTNNKNFILDIIGDEDKNLMFMNKEQILNHFNYLYAGHIHFKDVLFGKNEHFSKNNKMPNHMQKELNEICEEEHNFWKNRGYVYDEKLVYDVKEVKEKWFSEKHLFNDYTYVQRLKDEIKALENDKNILIKQKEDEENELHDVNKMLNNVKNNYINEINKAQKEYNNKLYVIKLRYNKAVNDMVENFNVMAKTHKKLSDDIVIKKNDIIELKNEINYLKETKDELLYNDNTLCELKKY